MKTVNMAFVHRLGGHLHKLAELKHTPQTRFTIFSEGWEVGQSVRQLLDDYPELKVSGIRAREFFKALEEVMKWLRGLAEASSQDPDKWNKEDPSTTLMFNTLVEKAKDLEVVILADLESLSAYHPSQKAAYSTDVLIAQAEKAFPPSILHKLDENTRKEIKEAGRCLAFDNHTAAGFHVMRALEVVLHHYYVSVCNPESNKKLGSWAAYLSAIYKLCDEKCQTLSKDRKDHAKKVYYLLQQIKDQDRNLIMHPEDTLGEDDALILFEVAKSAMMAMAEKLDSGAEQDGSKTVATRARSLSLSPAVSGKGSTVLITGIGFSPRGTVAVTYGGIAVGSYALDALGNFAATFLVPAAAVPGVNTVVATDTSTGMISVVAHNVGE